MRGVYEQQWQQALAGARIEPPDSLWDNIAANLDAERGRSGWVTLLLIAATVTIAFAFPLTIGNSSFESRPDAPHEVVQMQPEAIPVIPGVDSHSGAVKELPPTTSGMVIAPAVPAKGLTVSPPAREIARPPAAATGLVKPAAAKLVVASGYQVADITLNTGLAPVNPDDYYFIPFYLPALPEKRSLLASANLGTGSLSNGGGMNTFGALESADLAYAAGDTGFNSLVADGRQENPGSTYYVGAGVELPLGRRWSLQTGIGYLSQQATGTSNLVFDVGKGYQPLGAYDPIVPGVIVLREPYAYTVTNNYINIPVTFKYPFIDKKVKFRAGMGLSADFMLAHIVSADALGTSNYKPSSMGYNPIVLAGLVNLDVSYDFTNHYALAFETGWRRSFTAIDETRSYYPSSLTMGLVLFYQIR